MNLCGLIQGGQKESTDVAAFEGGMAEIWERALCASREGAGADVRSTSRCGGDGFH